MSNNHDEHCFQFLMSEFNSLRKEIENTTSQMRQMVTYVLLASGGFWAWYVSRESNSSNLILKLVPSFISLLFFLYNLSLSKDMKRAGDYISIIESYLDLPNNLGWENHIRKIGWSGFADYWDYLFWPTVIIGNVLGACLL